MNLLANFFAEAWIERLGWVLIHFLWEGTFIALVLALLLRLLVQASSPARYAVTAGALLACALAPAITWAVLNSQAGMPAPMAATSVTPMPVSSENITPLFNSSSNSGRPAITEQLTPWPVRLSQVADLSLPYMVGLWFLGVVILSTRLTFGWIWIKRLCRSGIPAQDPLCLENFQSLLARMRIGHPIRLLESALIEVPTLIGWLQPTILVPIALFTGMTPEQLEAIFAHELAHVRRYDYLANLLQTVIETVLFYHPAIWWISRKVREERENCCDDIVIDVMQNRLVYASALARLEEVRTPSLALTAAGGPLLQRIRRIAGVNDRKVSAWPLWLVILCLVPVVGLSRTRAMETTGSAKQVEASAELPMSELARAIQAKRPASEIQDLAVKELPSTGRDALDMPRFADGSLLNAVRLPYKEIGDLKILNVTIPLSLAALNSDLPAVKLLVENGAEVNALPWPRPPNPWLGVSPLALAASGGHDAVVGYLLEHGAKTGFNDIACAMYPGPLSSPAARESHENTVKLLIATGALKNIAEEKAAFLFASAFMNPENDLGMVSLLLNAGLNPNAKTGDTRFPGETAIDLTKKQVELETKYHFARNTKPLLELLEKAQSTQQTRKSDGSSEVDKADLNKALLAAAKQGDLGEISRLLQQGADPKANQYPDGKNALFVAAENNRVDAVKLLLQNGADPNGRNNSGNPPIIWVLDQGHLEVATVLHDAGAKISPEAWAGATDDLATLQSLVTSGVLKKGHTNEAMKYAVSMGHLDAVKFLEGIEGKPIAGKFLAQAARAGNIPMMDYILSQGANIQTDGGDAMDEAVIFFDQVAAVKFLLAHGADPNRFSKWQQYSLSEAKSAAMVKVLLDGGANPNVEDMFGTPLSMAPDAESVRLLVQHGANLRPQLKNGMTLIESVISRGLYDKADVIDELIKQGAEFNPTGNGASALARAAAGNQVRTMQVLLDHGVSPNAYSDEPFLKTSALHNAAWEPAPDAVKLLLARGANPDGDARDNSTPLAMAVIFGQTENADLLRKAGAHDVGALSTAAADGDAAKVTDLLKNGAPINETDSAGDTPLYYAVRRGHPEIAELLLAHGANLNQFNSNGVTPKLMFELIEGSLNPGHTQMDWGVSQEEGQRRIAAFKALFAKYPSDPNYRDSQGRTALHQMAFSGNTMVGFLTGDPTRRADPNLQDRDNNTPLLLASSSPHARELVMSISSSEDADPAPNKVKKWNTEAYIANELIKGGAKLDLVVAGGKTVGELALEAAQKANNSQLVDVLHAAGAKGN
jgi:ankyrin repeat protein/beta-lactamase regulating signal transducer with metallopeptidase domain